MPDRLNVNVNYMGSPQKAPGVNGDFIETEGRFRQVCAAAKTVPMETPGKSKIYDDLVNTACI